MFGLSPWVLLGEVVGFVAATLAAFFYGQHLEKIACDDRIHKIELQLSEAQQKQAQAELIQSSNASTGFQNDSAKARVVYRTLHDLAVPVISRPIYLNGCFDDDGLRLANAALRGVAPAANPAGPDAAMPRPNPAP